MPYKDRRPRPVITHRISCGRVSGSGRETRVVKLDHLEITTFDKVGDGPYLVDFSAMNALASPPFGQRYVFKTEEVDFKTKDKASGAEVVEKKRRVVGARRIPIRVDSDTIDDFLTGNYESTAMLQIPGRHGGFEEKRRPTVWCRGDGETAQRLSMADQKTWRQIRCCANPEHQARSAKDLRAALEAGPDADNPASGFRCPWAQNDDGKAFPRCSPVTTLICRSDVVSNIGAFCRYRTHAHSSSDYLYESLGEIKKQMPGGILRNVPLDLVLEMKNLPRPGGGMALQPVCHVELRVTLDESVRLLEANLRQEMGALNAAAEQKRLLLQARQEVEEEDDDGEFGAPPAVEGEQKPSGGLAILTETKT